MEGLVKEDVMGYIADRTREQWRQATLRKMDESLSDALGLGMPADEVVDLIRRWVDYMDSVLGKDWKVDRQ